MDHIHNETSVWRIQQAIDHLPLALQDVSNSPYRFQRASITVTGACALWYHVFSHPVDLRPTAWGFQSNPELEAERIVGFLSFPRLHTRYILHVESAERNGREEELDLDDEEEKWIAPLDIIYSSRAIPSKSFDLKDHPRIEIKIANGIWIVLDLVYSFLETNSRQVSSPKPSKLPQSVLKDLETAVATLALLLYSTERYAQHRSSLGLIAFSHSERKVINAIREDPNFERYAGALTWFVNLRDAELSKFSRIGAKYYYSNNTRADVYVASLQEHAGLALKIKRSLLGLQNSLLKLYRETSVTMERAPKTNWGLSNQWHNLVSVLSHPQFDFRGEPSVFERSQARNHHRRESGEEQEKVEVKIAGLAQIQ
ncbi:uncharacterized protein JCM6883_004243 [Sporobolomyces salmoneus]|uniref:uncharacterized protein n=1 Tax=Sporobolomyces salmoneus TaxID=183962 RepID=UPI00316F74E8